MPHGPIVEACPRVGSPGRFAWSPALTWSHAGRAFRPPISSDPFALSVETGFSERHVAGNALGTAGQSRHPRWLSSPDPWIMGLS